MHGGGDWADGGRAALRESLENFRESFASSFGGIEKFGGISQYLSQQLAEIDALQSAVGNDAIGAVRWVRRQGAERRGGARVGEQRLNLGRRLRELLDLTLLQSELPFRFVR